MTHPCVRCGLIARLDRCGYCAFCQWELAYQRIYINWALFAADWNTKGWTWRKGEGICSPSMQFSQES